MSERERERARESEKERERKEIYTHRMVDDDVTVVNTN